MSTFLIIDFDRYDTNNSTHQRVEADTPSEALRKSMGDTDFDQQEYEHLMKLFEEVDDTFSCVALEENDILIYKL